MSDNTQETVSVNGAPDVPGLTFRRFRGDEDFQAILEINNSSKIADGLDHDLHTLETIKGIYRNTRNHDFYRDMLIAEVDSSPVAYNRVFWEQEIGGPRIYWHFGFVLPEWRGKGIGTTLIGWAEQHAREIEATRPEPAAAYASTEVHSNMKALESLINSMGYEPVRYEFYMETPNLDNIPDVPMPEGLEVRPAQPEHYRTIWEANVEAFQDHWGATQSDDADFERFMSHPLADPSLWVVAWDGDQVAGSILNFINHEQNARAGQKKGYTENIGVRRPWRRRGLARALLARSMQLHKSIGMTYTALGVDTQNPSGALELYKSMGYEVKSQSTVYRKLLQ